MMIKLFKNGIFLNNGVPAEAFLGSEDIEIARKKTITYGILEKHNKSKDMDSLKLKFDSLISHDITYVGIIQTAKGSGLESCTCI